MRVKKKTLWENFGDSGQALPLLIAMVFLLLLLAVGLLSIEIALGGRARNQSVADSAALAAALRLGEVLRLRRELERWARLRDLGLEAAYSWAETRTEESSGTGSRFFREPLAWERASGMAIDRMANYLNQLAARAGSNSEIAAVFPKQRLRSFAILPEEIAGASLRLEELRFRLGSYNRRIEIIQGRLTAARRLYQEAKTGAAFEDLKLFRSSLGGLTAARNRTAVELRRLEERAKGAGVADRQPGVVVISENRRGPTLFGLGASAMTSLPAAAAAAVEVVEESSRYGSLSTRLTRVAGTKASAWFEKVLQVVSAPREGRSEFFFLAPYLPAASLPARVTYRARLVPTALVAGERGARVLGDWFADAQ